MFVCRAMLARTDRIHINLHMSDTPFRSGAVGFLLVLLHGDFVVVCWFSAKLKFMLPRTVHIHIRITHVSFGAFQSSSSSSSCFFSSFMCLCSLLLSFIGFVLIRIRSCFMCSILPFGSSSGCVVMILFFFFFFLFSASLGPLLLLGCIFTRVFSIALCCIEQHAAVINFICKYVLRKKKGTQHYNSIKTLFFSATRNRSDSIDDAERASSATETHRWSV